MCQYPKFHYAFPCEFSYLRRHYGRLKLVEMLHFIIKDYNVFFLNKMSPLKVEEQESQHQSFQKTLFFDVAGTCVHEDSFYSSLVCHTVDMQMVLVHHCVHHGCGC